MGSRALTSSSSRPTSRTRTPGDTIFPPYAIQQFPGIKVAVVGMTLEGTPSIVTAEATANLDFHDEADSVNALVPLLKRKGIETIIVLLHEGGSAGQPLNETTINSCGSPSGPIVDVVQRFDREIDLVVTGHTNWALNCSNFAGTGIMVTGAASVGRLVTDIDLTISRATKDVVGATINNVIVRRDAKPAAADITALINKYGEIAAPIENRVLGTASAALTRTQNAAGESSLGDIIADAQLWATSGPDWDPANGAPAVVVVHELRRHPRRHQRRPHHVRRDVQRPAVRQRARDDGHDGRADRRAVGAAVPGRQRGAPDPRLAHVHPDGNRTPGKQGLRHPDQRGRHRSRPRPTASRSTTSSPTAATTTPRSRRARTATSARSTSMRSPATSSFWAP